jgi:lactoylglutathione lyase
MKLTCIYTGLRVRDLDAALDFYTKGLGLKLTARSKVEETGGELAELALPGGAHYLELNWYPEGTKFGTRYEPGEALDHLGVKVEGATVKEAIRHLEQHGGKLSIPPFREASSWLAYVDSPDGHTIELCMPA